MSNPTRGRVIQTYKNLLHLGKNYPKGYDYFRDIVKTTFTRNKELTDPKQIDELLGKADYLAKELETLYTHRQYRPPKKTFNNTMEEARKLRRSY